jgi:hypothetical protein
MVFDQSASLKMKKANKAMFEIKRSKRIQNNSLSAVLSLLAQFGVLKSQKKAQRLAASELRPFINSPPNLLTSGGTQKNP